jgi:hypothetical protein
MTTRAFCVLALASLAALPVLSEELLPLCRYAFVAGDDDGGGERPSILPQTGPRFSVPENGPGYLSETSISEVPENCSLSSRANQPIPI